MSDLVARYEQLERAVEDATDRAASVRLIGEISELYRELRESERRLGELKRRLRDLLERNEWLSDRAEESAAVDPVGKSEVAAPAEESEVTAPAEESEAPDEESEAAAPAGHEAAPPAPAPASRSDRLGASTYREKGWASIAAGDYEVAKEMLGKALELAPDDTDALASLGWAQAMARDYDDALITFQRVLADRPDDPTARLNLGYICLKKEIYGEAVEHLTRAIDSDDRKARLYGNYYLGLVYLAREMYGEAETFLRTTTELSPGMCEAYFHLGKCLYRSGRKGDAISAWKSGATANRYDRWADSCRQAARDLEVGRTPSLD